ncbi:MAG: ankyrin repeat domain-containing protein [Planctomycetaceae bacterium]
MAADWRPPVPKTEAIEVIRLLLARGLDINVVDENGETVIHGDLSGTGPA